MRKISLYGLEEGKGGVHFLADKTKIQKFTQGGLHFYRPGEISHAGEKHIHKDHQEIFINLQGKATLTVEGKDYPFRVGDIAIIEPGEEHHLIADEADPLVNLWISG